MSDEKDLEESAQADGPEPSENKPSARQAIRDVLGAAAGLAVEIGSIVGGEGGDIVQAERDIAENRTEDLIDRIDGEG